MKYFVYVAFFTFFACQIQAFHLNHTCFTIKKRGWKPVQTCIDCFKSAYPDEKGDIDVLSDQAKECVKQLPIDYHKCTAETEAQKKCLEHVARHFFRKMRSRFWQHYTMRLTREERSTIREFIGVLHFFYEIRRNSAADYHKLNETMTTCRSQLLEDYRRFRRDSGNEISDNEVGDDTPVSDQEAREEEQEMDDGDYLKHNVKLMNMFTECISSHFYNDQESREIIYKVVENVKCSVPAALVRNFYQRKAA